MLTIDTAREVLGTLRGGNADNDYPWVEVGVEWVKDSDGSYVSKRYRRYVYPVDNVGYSDVDSR